jgi:hypothetical protein
VGVLAADQFNLRQLGTVAPSPTKTEQARVAAGSLLEPWGNSIEQFPQNQLICNIPANEPSSVNTTHRITTSQAPFGDGDQSLDERSKLLGTWHGRPNPFVPEQCFSLIA